ncbi:MAG: DUF2269 family protein [Chloroflexi bacterium]|nr:DUF2269 family protein [Chloroflexota bacterium]
MDLYPWVVFLHASTVLLFFIAHGASMAVAFRLKREEDPARVRALLDLSRFSLGVPTGVVVLTGLISGVLAGFLGGWWGELWIWISLVLFVAVGLAMTPLVSFRLNPIRAAAGMPPVPIKKDQAAPPEDPAELRRQLDAWNPVPVAVAGLAAFLVILYLMMVKPF